MAARSGLNVSHELFSGWYFTFGSKLRMISLLRYSSCTLAVVCTMLLASTSAAQQPEAQPEGEPSVEEAEQPAASEEAEPDKPVEPDEKAEQDEQPAGTVFSLSELTASAANNEDLVAEFKAKRAKAEWDQYRADHAWSPKITSTTALSVVPDNADPDELNENFDEIADLDIGPYIREDLDVVIPLYTFGRVSIAKELAELGVDNSKLELANARLDAIYQTKRAYWSLRLSRAFSEMLNEGEELISEQLEEMQDARDFGDADFDIEDFRKLEIFSAEIDERIVDNAKLATVASAGLHFLADISDEVAIEVPELTDLDSPPQLRSQNYYLGVAMEQRPEVLQLEKAVRARELEGELAQAEWYPNFFAALGVGWSWSTKETAFQQICAAPSKEDATGCDFPEDEFSVDGQQLYAEPYGDPLNRFSVQIGVGLRWQLDPLQQYANVQKKDAQLSVMQAQRRRARQAIRLEVKKLYQDAADALEKIAINKRRMTAARRWRDQLGLSHQTAGADIADAVQPLKAYFEARAKYLQAVYDYFVARGALARGIGAQGLGDDGAISSD
jgi:outer membrane protein TolC